MKGALSDPNSVLYDELQAALFPDTTYRFESGGTPRAIPDLTYEQLPGRARRHYRLDNSYLTLYGNVDLDRDAGVFGRGVPLPRRRRGGRPRRHAHRDGKPPLDPHPLDSQAPVRGRARGAPTWPPRRRTPAHGAGLRHRRRATSARGIVAVDILLDAVMGSNEAPLKRALLDAGLADDVQAFVADGASAALRRHAAARVEARGRRALPRRRRRRRSPPWRSGGLDHALVEASLSRAEFIMRERDFGMADGVALSMTALSGWLYDDELATTYLRYEDDFAFLRRELGTGYFERLIRSTCSWKATTVADGEVRPRGAATGTPTSASACGPPRPPWAPRTSQRVADEEADAAPPAGGARLARGAGDAAAAVGGRHRPGARRARLRPGRGHARALRAPPYYPRAASRTPTATSTWARARFEELPYVAVLALVLGKLGTARHSAAEIDTLVNGPLGNLSFFAEIYEDDDDARCTSRRSSWSGASALSENVDAAWPSCRARSCWRPTSPTPGRSKTCCSSGASAWSRASPQPAMRPPWRARHRTTCRPASCASSWAAWISTAS